MVISVKWYSFFAILFVVLVSFFKIDWLTPLVALMSIIGLFFVGERTNKFPPTYEGLRKKYESDTMAIYTRLETTFPVFGGTMFDDGSVVKFGMAGLVVRRSSNATMYVLDRFGNVSVS